ncbi:hormogonium polysaccharide biosynthesis glycosyltransferase HpsE [Sodalinema gerasimenkoae]|uniref:hormogonium polysaccharide biosynthesis glycosyltransferase HpsE n=1 Tax=Sodalinema gerasimenkoae TaxID=2862348 RepID=UPI00135737F1|nr:hormogonium polysaccharide biosynthesis glycosyltransferase HpsE [Sodalinema gerasimenkoae]
MDFTVAIRTYNGEARIGEILERLKAQAQTDEIEWEIVVVDNNSSDQTAAIIQSYQEHWPSHSQLHYFFEPQQGASYARARCIKEAHSELIGFLDDDNYPAEDWVFEAHQFSESYPKAGAYSGQIHGDYEIEPPPNFKRIANFIPIIERGKNPLCYTSYKYARKKVYPPGAGLVIRKQAWLDSVPKKLVLQGPVGTSLNAKGEDIEALSYLAMAGWEIWYNPKMHIYHQIPARRFERDYLIEFFRGVGLSRHRTRMLNYKPWQKPWFTVAYFVNDCRKLLRHAWQYRDVLEDDVVAAAELQFFKSCLVSPLFIWKMLYISRDKRSKP